MKGDIVLNVCMGVWVLFVLGVFALTLATLPPPSDQASLSSEHDEEEHTVVDDVDPNVTLDGGVNLTGAILISEDENDDDPTWRELRKWRLSIEERIEYDKNRVCGRDPATDITDKKCNATVLFDLPANKTISLAKHLRSHTRLKRRVLTLERMMRVAMAYIKLGAAVRSGQGRK